MGETDASGMFTLLEFECLGACDRAPVVMVNNEHWHEHATPEIVREARGRFEEQGHRRADGLSSAGGAVMSAYKVGRAAMNRAVCWLRHADLKRRAYWRMRSTWNQSSRNTSASRTATRSTSS